MSSLWRFLPTLRRQESTESVAGVTLGEQVDVKGEKSPGDSDVQELQADSVIEADTEVNPAGLSLEEGTHSTPRPVP